MGDAVNLASRLEGITKEYGAGIVVGENTKEAAPDFVYRELDWVRVKGKDKPVAIFEPLGLVGQVEDTLLEEVRMFAQVLRAYRSQDWDQAELQLRELQKRSPQAKLYQVYLERIAYFRSNPLASDWDGVFVFKTK
jgi:adenylate cyclase